MAEHDDLIRRVRIVADDVRHCCAMTAEMHAHTLREAARVTGMRALEAIAEVIERGMQPVSTSAETIERGIAVLANQEAHHA